MEKVWDTLNMCYDYPEKYIAEALDPIIKFQKYKAYEHADKGGLLPPESSHDGCKEGVFAS
jgi:hypothetical protein